MANLLAFLIPFGLLATAGATVIGIGCWWPAPDDRLTVTALQHRLDYQNRFRTRPLRCTAHAGSGRAYYPRRYPSAPIPDEGCSR